MGWPGGIAIDFTTNRIHWTDSAKGYIASWDLNGGSFIKKILEFGSQKIFSEFVAMNKHLVYFQKNPTGGRKTVAGSDFSADEDLETINEINVLAGNMSHSIFDIKAYDYSEIQTEKK